MRRNEKGFSVIEILIVIVVIGLIGTIGWLVYSKQQNRSSDNGVNTQASQQNDIANEGSTDSRERQAIFAQACSSTDVNNRALRNQKLESVGIRTGNTVDLIGGAGSECVLNTGDTLLSFSQTTSATNVDGTIDSTHKYGIVIVSGSGAAPEINDTLACAAIPPDPTNPPVISAVIDGRATLGCPGYEGATYTYDFALDKFSKN